MCVPWELNPQPFALLTQCSTTEPQEHNPGRNGVYILDRAIFPGYHCEAALTKSVLYNITIEIKRLDLILLKALFKGVSLQDCAAASLGSPMHL